MFNNRMLAVAAVLVMAVPALGAATPIVVPPVPEQLVEGHTVFTVIEIVKQTRTTEVRFAAAVAVLVREYQAQKTASRFPGVLWFNDQYLVNPTEGSSDFNAFRYPCGGAVMAVNAGDPDPRVAIARVDVQDQVNDPTGTNPGGITPVPVSQQTSVGATNHTYAASDNWVKPYPDEYHYGDNSAGHGAPTDYAWVGVKDQGVANNATSAGSSPGSAQAYSDTTVGSIAGGADQTLFNATPPWDYRESYLITDPNDHSWVIDKYNFYTRDQVSATTDATTPPGAGTVTPSVDSQNVDNLGPKTDGTNGGAPNPSTEHFPIANGGDLETLYSYPVWVVNVLGTPVFVPDSVLANDPSFAGEFLTDNCLPFRDLLDQLTAPTNGALCGAAVDNGNPQGGADSDIHLSPGSPVAPFTDDPCMGYMEPSRNGYCYGGQQATDVNGDGVVDKNDCLAMRQGNYADQAAPLRLYNALLYFKLQDLTVAGAARDHSDPVNSGDTNGCSQEQYWWGPNPPQAATQYPCPGGNDDNEGNSHSFHPSAPTHEEQQPCDPAFGGPNPTNHGGSTYINPGDRAADNGYFQTWAPCDYAHATRNIDIYFSPGGRPFPPVVRNFDVMDLEGSSAPFQDFHSAYPGVSP